MNEKNCKNIVIFLSLALAVVLAGFFLLWWEIRLFETEIHYYYVPPQRSFVYSSEEISEYGFEEYVLEKITVEKARLVEEKKSFIGLDLKAMNLILYKEGEIFKNFSVQSKGKNGTWWETPPGAYFVGDKIVKHFSSVANVWAPYAVQFYGNFFIHGWPYDTLGRDLLPGPSGGCVRMRTSDAAVVFEFAKRGMPVLVFEEKTSPPFSALLPKEEKVPILNIGSKYFLVADLHTGEILLSREIDSEIYAGPIVSGMMALTASEIVNLEKRIIAREWMIEGVGENIIKPGLSYRAHDLLRPLLIDSSEEAVSVLSRFLTPDHFVSAMNDKSQAIGMNNTVFENLSLNSVKNITTLHDIAKMMRYILQYRGFIFDISREMKGLEENEKESLFTVLKMSTNLDRQILGRDRNIFIALIGSADAEKDLEAVLLWLDNGLGLK